MADIQFNLRVPEELKEKIKEAASESGRSINAEAQYRLEQSFEDNNHITKELIKDAVLMTLEAVKKHPHIIDNPNIIINLEDTDNKKAP
ncbi:Arc family DNA-binding protein [Acinetobacter guerrae]|uniref:Arc family DNA-binding protein n=1 Tax=Acinetobacter guerrae TaxID=1843371 RepID=UPI001F5040E5|nr:Arc family DNA-binding protein [Acinetobacter guerrae]MPW43379.1 hypothetical protein [Acinetobacter guerrae]